MNELRYNCMKCGICCFEIEGPESKRIPLYPEEVNRLIEFAKKKKLDFNVIEDLVFPDILNHKIIVITYRIILNSNGHCPFYDNNKGCTIQDTKPLACSAYPLALKQIDAFNFQISIDPLCRWTISNYDSLTNINSEEVKSINSLVLFTTRLMYSAFRRHVSTISFTFGSVIPSLIIGRRVIIGVKGVPRS